MIDWSPMQPFRSRLDDVDEEIIKLFGERYKIRREVGAFKKLNKLPAQDQSRVDEVIQRAKHNAINYNVPTDFAEALYKMVIDYSHKFEEETE
jgi:chorismate mutase